MTSHDCCVVNLFVFLFIFLLLFFLLLLLNKQGTCRPSVVITPLAITTSTLIAPMVALVPMPNLLTLFVSGFNFGPCVEVTVGVGGPIDNNLVKVDRSRVAFGAIKLLNPSRSASVTVASKRGIAGTSSAMGSTTASSVSRFVCKVNLFQSLFDFLLDYG